MRVRVLPGVLAGYDSIMLVESIPVFRCGKCLAEKPASEFYERSDRPGVRTSYCIECTNANSQEHYQANKAAYAASRQAARERYQARAQAFLREYFAEHPCVDCGCLDLRVLQFDHRDAAEKEHTIARMLRSQIRWSRVLDEIAKCDVRCANCHMIRTAEQFGWWRHFA